MAPPHSAAAIEPTDAELETAIVRAITMGLASVAETLGAQLRERQHRRAGVVAIGARQVKK